MCILTIPADVIIMVMQYLTVKGLKALSSTCKPLHALVEEFGWNVYLTLNPRPSRSYSKSTPSWTARTHVRVNTVVDQQWSSAQFVARPLSNRWTGKLQPILAINSSRLFLAAGNTIYSYGFGTSSVVLDDAPSVLLEGIYSTSDSAHPKTDITSLTCPLDGADDYTVFVGYANGTIERLILPPSSGPKETTYVESSLRVIFDGHGDSNIVESLCASSAYILSLASSGTAGLHSISHLEDTSDMINLSSRSWSCLLSTRGSRPFAAFGTSSIHPLAVHDVLPSGISTHPFTLLDVPSDSVQPTAVYDITSPPISSPWGASDQIVISGWFDGFVRVHDFRSSARKTIEPGTDTPTSTTTSCLLPTLTFADPWSFEPIYSLSCGGGSGAHIAAGSARHSVVAFWDVRSSGTGWSVHAPGNDSSPVYSVIMDGPRVFGANQSRGFVLDFGPGIHEHTYPAININTPAAVPGAARRGRREVDENLRRAMKGPGFYVTKYNHARARWTGKSL